MIVITKPKWRTLPEALRRLWYRDRGNAVIAGVTGLTALLLGVGMPTGGIYLAATGGIVEIVLGVVITLAGPYMASDFWRSSGRGSRTWRGSLWPQ
jgi:hypothetical protein